MNNDEIPEKETLIDSYGRKWAPSQYVPNSDGPYYLTIARIPEPELTNAQLAKIITDEFKDPRLGTEDVWFLVLKQLETFVDNKVKRYLEKK